jgi:hypothetical protein
VFSPFVDVFFIPELEVGYGVIADLADKGVICVNYKYDKLYEEYKILLFINYFTAVIKSIKVYKGRDL